MTTSEFDRAMHNIYVRAREEANYNASYFLQMLEDMGGLGTAKQLINSPKASQGFTKLWELGRLDLSVEALVLKPEWSDLFTSEELDRARRRLAEYGLEISPPESTGDEPLTMARAAELIDEAARDRPIGELQELRKQLKGLTRARTHSIFTNQTIQEDYAFHDGGREELQFNIGFEDREGERFFRHGVAFSLEPSRSLPDPLDVLLPKIARFNEYISESSHGYDQFRFWYHSDEGWSQDSIPRAIGPGEVRLRNFLFLGRRYPGSDFDVDAILTDWEALLPLYEFVESPAGAAFGTTSQIEVEFSPGHSPRQQETGSRSRVEGELKVEFRHNRLQGALYERLVDRFGKKSVRTEWPCAPGVQVDAAVRVSENEFWFYEIKTSRSVRSCIRQALAQILEYAFWPDAERASRLIIVGQEPPDSDSEQYLARLREQFGIPVYYEACELPSPEGPPL